MLYWGPAKTIYDNWSKGSHLLLDRGAVRYKMAHYIGVLQYIKKNPEKWTLKVARLKPVSPGCNTSQVWALTKSPLQKISLMFRIGCRRKLYKKIDLFFMVFDEFYPRHTVSQTSRADLGVGRGGRGHPFFIDILYYFYRILRKIKSIYIAGKWASDPPLKIYENDHKAASDKDKTILINSILK